MESSCPNKARGDLRSRLNSPASVDGGQGSHSPSIHEQGQPILMFVLPFLAWVVYRRMKPCIISW